MDAAAAGGGVRPVTAHHLDRRGLLFYLGAAAVVQPGQPRANYGCFPHGAEIQTPDIPATLRTYLVAASMEPAA